MKKLITLMIAFISSAQAGANCIDRNLFQESYDLFEDAKRVFIEVNVNREAHRDIHRDYNNMARINRTIRSLEEQFAADGVDPNAVRDSSVTSCDHVQDIESLTPAARLTLNRLCLEEYTEEAAQNRVLLRDEDQRLAAIHRVFATFSRGRLADPRAIMRLRRAVIFLRNRDGNLLNSEGREIVQRAMTHSYRNFVQASEWSVCPEVAASAARESVSYVEDLETVSCRPLETGVSIPQSLESVANYMSLQDS